MNKRPNSILGGAGFYTVLGLCLVAVGAASWFLLTPRTAPGADGSAGSAEASAPQQQPVRAEEPSAQTAAPARVVTPEAPAVSAAGTPQMPEAAADDTPVAAEAPRLVVAPLKGEVVSAFSVDRLTYDETLADWRTHAGEDIAAAQGTAVLAACAGTVLSVEDDAMMGTTVVLSHSDGYQTSYANLQSKPAVKKGDSVSAGQILGAVGETSIAESAEGPHLHFAVTKNGDAVDPQAFLNR